MFWLSRPRWPNIGLIGKEIQCLFSVYFKNKYANLILSECMHAYITDSNEMKWREQNTCIAVKLKPVYSKDPTESSRK